MGHRSSANDWRALHAALFFFEMAVHLARSLQPMAAGPRIAHHRELSMKPIAGLLMGLAATGLAACQPAASDGGPAPAATPGDAPAANLIASAQSLAGEYRVAGVDGADINLPHGISAEITADRIAVTSDCINLGWTYHFQNGALATERVPMASCRRALLPEEGAIAAAFDNAGMVRRTPANGVEFTGGGHSVLLFSQ
jgi:hypothetical protein